MADNQPIRGVCEGGRGRDWAASVSFLWTESSFSRGGNHGWFSFYSIIRWLTGFECVPWTRLALSSKNPQQCVLKCSCFSQAGVKKKAQKWFKCVWLVDLGQKAGGSMKGRPLITAGAGRVRQALLYFQSWKLAAPFSGHWLDGIHLLRIKKKRISKWCVWHFQGDVVTQGEMFQTQLGRSRTSCRWVSDAVVVRLCHTCGMRTHVRPGYWPMGELLWKSRYTQSLLDLGWVHLMVSGCITMLLHPQREIKRH